MSRHGYTDAGDMDPLELGRWRGKVASAIRGKRGQKMFRELVAALEAMPQKRLVARQLQTKDGDCCTLGCLAAAKGKDLSEYEDADEYDLGELNPVLAETFDIAECLVQEVEWENDEGGWNETPEQRWERMHKWAKSRIKETV